MNKIRKAKLLIAILTVAAVLMGAGYAAWADELNVGGTVATGEIDMRFTEDTLTVPHTNPPDLLSGDSFISEDGKKVTFTMDNLYPGHPQSFRLYTKKVNVGSIPARFHSAELQFGDPLDPAINFLEAKLEVNYAEYPGGPNHAVSDITEDWFPLVQLADKLNASAQLKSAVFDTGGWIAPQCLRIRLREDAPNETQKQAVLLTLEMNFIQWNQ